MQEIPTPENRLCYVMCKVELLNLKTIVSKSFELSHWEIINKQMILVIFLKILI